MRALSEPRSTQLEEVAPVGEEAPESRLRAQAYLPERGATSSRGTDLGPQPEPALWDPLFQR